MNVKSYVVGVGLLACTLASTGAWSVSAPPTVCVDDLQVGWNPDTAQYLVNGSTKESGLLSIDPGKSTVAIIGASVDLALGDAMIAATDQYNVVVAYCDDRTRWDEAADWLLGESGPVEYAIIGMHVDIFKGTVPVSELQQSASALSDHLRDSHSIPHDAQLISIYPEWEFNAPGWWDLVNDQPQREARSLEYGNHFRGLNRRTAAVWSPYNDNGDDIHADATTTARAIERFIYHLDNMTQPMPWGTYWNFDYDGYATPWDSNGTALITESRFADHVCAEPGSNTPATCKMDTRASIEDHAGQRWELITANGRYWNFHQPFDGVYLTGELWDVDKYKVPNGPCYGRAHPCIFDTHSMMDFYGLKFEFVTAYGKYFTYRDDVLINFGWMYQRPQWADICEGKGENCKFDAMDVEFYKNFIYDEDAQEWKDYYVESIIAYGKWYNINAMNVSERLGSGDLLDVPWFRSGPCAGYVVGGEEVCTFDTFDTVNGPEFTFPVQSISVSP